MVAPLGSINCNCSEIEREAGKHMYYFGAYIQIWKQILREFSLTSFFTWLKSAITMHEDGIIVKRDNRLIYNFITPCDIGNTIINVNIYVNVCEYIHDIDVCDTK